MDWWATLSNDFVVFIITALLVQALCELLLCLWRWRRRAAADRFLDSVPDVPYSPLPDQPASSCVICMAEYAGGEGRFVMPGCVHAFHRGCIAEWLRMGKTTCPISRANAIVVVEPPPQEVAGEEEDTVAGVSSVGTDMV